MKILIFIDHDIIVRHFVHSGVFSELARHHDVVFVLPEAGSKRITAEVFPKGSVGGTVDRLPVASSRLRLWQGLMLANALRWRAGEHYMAMRRFHRFAAGTKAAVIYGLLSLPGIYAAYEAWVHRKLARDPYTELEAILERHAPDVLIHPSVLNGVYVNDLVQAAKRRRLPLVMIMNSWDNPSTKRAMSGLPDWLLVWGPQTREHAERFMNMPAERTVSFGAAQFDVYRSAPRISRREFCILHDIDPQSCVLLYAGSSKGTDEFQHLCMIDEAIERGQLGHMTVVYRPHPWGGGGKGGGRILDHPWRNVRIERTMRKYLQGLRSGNPGITTPDYRDTHDLLSAIDILVSPLSTILIEGAIHGKPVLCFLPDEADAEDHFGIALPLTHFDDMFAEPVFLVARGAEELLPRLAELKEKSGDEEFAVSLRRACQRFVAEFDQPYGQRLVEFIASMGERLANASPSQK